MNQYGDIQNVKKDAETINVIIDRQGTTFLLHLIAEHCGNTTLKFKLNDQDSKNVMNSILTELKESILERI